MTDLPAQSRITSRTDGSTLIITIPLRRRGGCASWGGVAAFAFLAIVCMTQGMLARRLGWTAVGLVFLVIAAWQWAMLARWGTVVIEISPESMTLIQSGTAGRSRWDRANVPRVRADTGGLRLAASIILPGHDPDELEWLADQIRRKWGMQ
jgi:hypothetical protein